MNDLAVAQIPSCQVLHLYYPHAAHIINATPKKEETTWTMIVPFTIRTDRNGTI